jgi:hypothetical protein
MRKVSEKKINNCKRYVMNVIDMYVKEELKQKTKDKIDGKLYMMVDFIQSDYEGMNFVYCFVSDMVAKYFIDNSNNLYRDGEFIFKKKV